MSWQLFTAQQALQLYAIKISPFILYYFYQLRGNITVFLNREISEDFMHLFPPLKSLKFYLANMSAKSVWLFWTAPLEVCIMFCFPSLAISNLFQIFTPARKVQFRCISKHKNKLFYSICRKKSSGIVITTCLESSAWCMFLLLRFFYDNFLLLLLILLTFLFKKKQFCSLCEYRHNTAFLTGKKTGYLG